MEFWYVAIIVGGWILYTFNKNKETNDRYRNNVASDMEYEIHRGGATKATPERIKSILWTTGLFTKTGYANSGCHVIVQFQDYPDWMAIEYLLDHYKKETLQALINENMSYDKITKTLFWTQPNGNRTKLTSDGKVTKW